MASQYKWNTEKIIQHLQDRLDDVEIFSAKESDSRRTDKIILSPKDSDETLILQGGSDTSLSDSTKTEVYFIALNDGRYEDVAIGTNDTSLIQLFAEVIKIMADEGCFLLSNLP